MKVHPATAAGTMTIPGSKSFTHRAYVLAATAEHDVLIENPLRAADPEATLRCIRQLGIEVRGEADVLIHGGTPQASHAPLDCANAGTGLRLLTALAARYPFATTFTGDASLRGRPNDILLDALRSLGADIRGDDAGRCPYAVQGPIHGGKVRINGGTSSQFASALMLSLPQAPGDSHLVLEEPVRSRPYLEVTRRVLRSFGLRVPEGDDMHIEGGQRPSAATFHVPGDWSTAAFPMAAAAITDGDIVLRGLDPMDPQGDRRIAGLLAEFGARVDIGDSVRVRSGGLVSPGEIDVTHTPDLFPILAVVAACAQGTTTFTGGATLRHKESDRIAAVAAGLTAMGIVVEEKPAGLVVHGGTLQGAAPALPDDHRIHMAFYVAALAADGPSHIDHAPSTMISFPTFHEEMARMAGVR